ncbi:MAG: FecR domain-containing protein, partial [Candidatus Geothermincolia bacterium]
MTDRRKINKRIRVDEKFDEREPMAQAVRSLIPADSRMDPEARERMMGHLLSVQRGLQRDTGVRRAPRLRQALVPALAVVLIAAVLGAVLVPMFFGGTSKKRATAPQPAKFLNLVGSVQVLQPGADVWRAAGAQDLIKAGWSIRTATGSLASIRFPEGSIARVTEGSQVKIARVAADEVEIDHVSGGTYHRVHKGTKYTVVNGDVASQALGTAFNVENRVPEHLEILTVESAVEVSIGSHEPIKVSQGEVMTVSMSQDKKADKQPVSRERLQDSRLMASVQQDAEAGFSTGVYENLDVPVDVPQEPAQTTPAQAPSIQMAAEVSDLIATLSWTLSGTADYGSLVLLRSEGSEPSYPTNEIASY